MLAKQLMAQSSAALAPLNPIFDIIGAVVAIKDFADAVASNPFSVASAVRNLANKVDQLLSLIPQLSVPLMILTHVDLVLAYLQGLSAELDAMALQEASIAASLEVAEQQNLAVLSDVAACAGLQLQAQLSNLKAGAGPVDGLIEVLNTFVSLVPGIPQIPSLGMANGGSVAEAKDAVSQAVVVLTVVRNSIPI